MKHLIFFLAFTLVCTPALHADYILDRKVAAAFQQKRQYTEALDAYRAMAKGDVNDFQKSDALTQAAICAALLDKHDLAIELIDAIPLAPEAKAARMQVMHISRQWKELVEQFGDEDLSAWPDYVANEAYRVRGLAALFTKDYERATTDLEAALRFPMDLQARGTTLNMLGAAYSNLGRDDRALEVYQTSLRVADEYRAAGAAMAISRIHTARGEHDKAAQILDTIDMDRMKSIIWKCMAIAARGDVLAGKGDTDGAIAHYEKALAVEGIPDHFKTTCEKKIADLRPDTE